MTKYAELLPLLPNRTDQVRSGMEIAETVLVGVTDDGEAMLSATYDDGMTYLDQTTHTGEQVETFDLEPMFFSLQYHSGLVIDVYRGGDFSVTLQSGRSVLIEAGRPWDGRA